MKGFISRFLKVKQTIIPVAVMVCCFKPALHAQDTSFTTPPPKQKLGLLDIPPTVNKGRLIGVSVGGVVAYGGTLAALNEFWYKNYPRSSFHFYNDNAEWNQIDKAGHAYSAYLEGKICMEMLRWAGVKDKTAIWVGGLSGTAYQTIIEILDGYSAEWGFSMGDMTMNLLGSGILISQYLAWGEERIQFKFSTHFNNYTDPELRTRAMSLYGTSVPERILKDYNAQTYWLSVNPWSFNKESRFPKWLNIAVGYGADGMFGGYTNTWTDKYGTPHDRTDVQRIRQFYLAPDIDLTKIKTNKKGLKLLFGALNVIKFPLPALEINTAGKVRFHPIYF
jgi:hypothetical protein